MYIEDTIAAISTPPGSAGIGVVRMSGPKAIEIADLLFGSIKSEKTLKDVKSHTVHYGWIIDPNSQEKVDEVLIIVMKAPNTYTKEDVIEINCHGGFIPVKRILELTLEHGARIAEPGEFTKRAFLNGRLDLTQAEAVIDLIHSKTETSMQTAVNQLEGSLSHKIKEFKQRLLELIAHIEVSIDYPEHEMEYFTYQSVESEAEKLIDEIEKLIQTADTGKILREGLQAVIVGKPNVGKSSLLNALLREKRAIVTDIPGTTRDVIEEFVNIRGIPMKIMDTAGIRETSDIVEKIGVEKSKEFIEIADVVIFILNASESLSSEDEEIMDMVKNKKAIIILNKIDLPRKIDVDRIKSQFTDYKIIEMSVKEFQGLEALEDTILEMFEAGNIQMKDHILVTNVRHKNALIQAKESLKKALESSKMQMPEDCIAIDLRGAWEKLGEITGDSATEDLLEQIFSQFCLGK